MEMSQRGGTERKQKNPKQPKLEELKEIKFMFKIAEYMSPRE